MGGYCNSKISLWVAQRKMTSCLFNKNSSTLSVASVIVGEVYCHGNIQCLHHISTHFPLNE